MEEISATVHDDNVTTRPIVLLVSSDLVEVGVVLGFGRVQTLDHPAVEGLWPGCLRPFEQIACTERINNDVLLPTIRVPYLFSFSNLDHHPHHPLAVKLPSILSLDPILLLL